MISEIHCMSHPLQAYPSPTANAERIHRHASRVRRVACERIGAERLHAYCDRVKEAFEAYMQGGWGGAASGYAKSDVSDVDDGEEEEEEEGDDRGRGMEREGSRKRQDGPPSPPKEMEVDPSAPPVSPVPSLSSGSESGEDTDGSFEDERDSLLKIDLEGVVEVEEEEHEDG